MPTGVIVEGPSTSTGVIKQPPLILTKRQAKEAIHQTELRATAAATLLYTSTISADREI